MYFDPSPSSVGVGTLCNLVAFRTIYRENDTWQCLLCMNFADIPESILAEKKEGELSLKERKIAERLVLELYCQYDPSLPFREVIGPEVRNALGIMIDDDDITYCPFSEC